MIKIEKIDDVRLGPYRTLRAKGPIFVAESAKVVKALLESPLKVLSVLALPHYYDTLEKLIEDKGVLHCSRYVADAELMEKIVGYRLHQGIMAIGARPPSATLESLNGPIVALNGLCNAENVGAIVRNCAAFGVNNMIADSKSSSPFLRRSIRVSMGAIFSVQVHSSENLTEALLTLRDRGYTIIGADLYHNVVDVAAYRFPENYVLVVGTEGTGLQEEIVDICDVLVKIPIAPSVESLNVASATAVLLHAASKK